MFGPPLLAQQLDHDLAFKLMIMCLENGTECAIAQFFLEFVVGGEPTAEILNFYRLCHRRYDFVA